MRRTATIWLAFALCLALVLTAMAWISVTALEADRAERRATRQAAAEEAVRLALWHMDSALVPLITQESARPYFVYQPFHPIAAAYTPLGKQFGPREVLVPSPLLTFEAPEVLLHFRLDGAGRLTSPQAPAGSDYELALDGYTTAERVRVAAQRLEQLRGLLDRGALLAALPAPPPVVSASPPVAGSPRPQPAQPPAPGPAQQEAAQDAAQLLEQQAKRQLDRREITDLFNAANTAARYRVNDQAQALQYGQQFNPALSPAVVAEGALRPCWVGEALLLGRRVNVDGQEHILGCWLNWPHLRQWLLEDAGDLLPHAALSPRPEPLGGEGNRLLATLPVRLEPGNVPAALEPPPSPVRLSLAIAWACVLLGAAAVAVLLGKAVSLSERRGAFVSAVTHELRTPLTTFRLYAEMLAEGMVCDEAKRAAYLRRLRDEADRLSHLVENVLAYARLAGPRSAAHLGAVPLEGLLDRSRERLAALAERAEMRLVVDDDGAAGTRSVRCDSSAVEQILLNLVDNACKYAGRAADRRIHIRAELRDGFGVLSVRDHGPGVAPGERGRLFQAFRKSARQAARSAPGIGLGLALSRRLARNMGGDLRLEDDDGGARFALLLPAAT